MSFPKKVSSCIVATLTLILVGCSPDERIDPKYVPQLEGTAFYGSNNAWLVNRKGDLLWTTDAGGSWRTVPGEELGGFDQITFIDDRNGWGTTRDRKVLRTTDGGAAWASTQELLDKRYGPGLGQIKFIDEKHGWIVHPHFFWRTEDGGATWQQYPFPYKTHQSVNYCFFIDALLGWLSGPGGALYRTQDGGKTWQQEIGMEDRDLSEVTFVDPLLGWVAASPKDGVYYTEDGGRTWTRLEQPRSVFFSRSVQFTTRSEGWVAGTDSANGEPSDQKPIVLHTTNGGQSWERVTVAEDQPFVHQVHFTDSAHGWLLGRNNVYHTEDGGKSWSVVLSLPPVAKK